MSVVAAIRRMLSDGLTIDQALIAAEAIESEVAPRRKAKPVQDEIEAEFEQHFWPIYPRRVGKGQALKAYRSARKATDLETIVVGVRRYAAARSGENPDYTKHPATWLNGQCWTDEPAMKAIPHSRPANPRQQMWIDEFNKQNGPLHEPDSDNGSFLDLGDCEGQSRSNGGPVRLAYARSR